MKRGGCVMAVAGMDAPVEQPTFSAAEYCYVGGRLQSFVGLPTCIFVGYRFMQSSTPRLQRAPTAMLRRII